MIKNDNLIASYQLVSKCGNQLHLQPSRDADNWWKTDQKGGESGRANWNWLEQ